jgi:hypothetical protein
MPLDELRGRFANMRSVIAKSVEVMPTHSEFIAGNCAAPPIQWPDSASATRCFPLRQAEARQRAIVRGWIFPAP